MQPATRVPLVDLSAQFASIRGEVMRAIEAAISSSALFLGPHTRAFEEEFAAYCGTPYAVGVANGTDALHLALRAAGIGASDEVVTVSHTFIATIEAIHQVGARPVLVDIDPRTFTLDPTLLEAAITPRTRAIVPVHLYGRLADMDAVTTIARQHGLLVIEDASQSQGAADARGRMAGALGDIACFSFYYAKNLGAYGEAGAVTTSSAEIDARLRLLRSHGVLRRPNRRAPARRVPDPRCPHATRQRHRVSRVARVHALFAPVAAPPRLRRAGRLAARLSPRCTPGAPNHQRW